MVDQVVITDGVSGQDAPVVDNSTQQTSQVAQETPSERPQWLPEKFKSPEDLAKAYDELSKKLGQQSQTPPQEQQAQSGQTTETASTETQTNTEAATDDAAAQVVEQAGLNLQDLFKEHADTGQLSQNSYESLQKIGIGKDVVDAYIAGQQARAAQIQSEVFNSIGGQQEYNQMAEWAKLNLPQEKLNAYNKAVDSNDMDQVKFAVQGLHSQFKAAVGSEPNLVHGAESPSGEVYTSTAQVVKDMGKPEYQSDPAFRKQVEAKLARSKVF